MEEHDPEQPAEWAVGPEDEYDALNDETFGDTTGGEYTWEDASGLFSDPHLPDTTQPNGGASNGFTNIAQQMTAPVDPATDPRTKETDYYDFENDNALEESISRLVLDDLEDSEDEEDDKKAKFNRFGASHFNTYFMPPQVANKHMHWLMDKELPGGSSLLGSSVWSMHPTTTPDVTPIQHTASSPHRTIQPIVPSNSMIKQPVRANHISSSEDSVDLENNVSKFFGGVPSSTPQNSTSKKPVFKTVEEIERELLEGDSNTTPKLIEDANLNHSKPKVMTAEELERELIEASPMPTHKQQEFDNTGRSPLQNLSQFNQLFSPEPHTARQNQQKSTQQQHQQQQQPQQLGSMNAPNMGPSLNINFSNIPGGPPVLSANASVNNLIMMEQQKQLLLARQGLLPAPGHPALHPGIVAGGPLPPQLPQGFVPGLSPLQHQQQLRMLQMHPHMRPRMPMIMPLPHVLHMRPPVGFPHPQIPTGYRKQMKTDDPYRGMMNEKDKQRLRNIQIIQLQNDHPFTTDYYDLMHKAKRAAPGGLQLLTKLYPKRDDESINKRQYEPARFENCLGKLQAVSALAPKRVIDTFIRVTECRNSPRGGVKAYRYLLLEIEQLYECLLTMEESDIRMSILCNADEKDLLRRSLNAKRVTTALTNNEKLLSILYVPKGKMLICRALPLIDPSWRYKIIGHLLDIFPLWGNEKMDKAYPYLRHCILHAEIRDLLTVIGAVSDTQVFESIVLTRLGISILTCIFHKAEELLRNCEQILIEDVESHWTRKTVFVISAIVVKSEDLANPIEFYPTLLQHIRRFGLHNTDIQMVESIVQRWANVGIPAGLTPRT